MTEKQENIQLYEKYAAKAPNWYMEPSQLLDVIEYYEDNGRHLDAEVCLRQALTLHPDDMQLLIKKAYFLKSVGRVEEADAVIAGLGDTTDIEVLFYQVERALARFDSTLAEDIFAQIVTMDDPDIPDWSLWTEMAEICLDYGYVRMALNAVGKVPRDDKNYKRACVLQGECYYQLHQVQRSVTFLNKALDIDPYDAALWGMLADIHYENRQMAQAVEACQYALAIDAKNEKALRVNFFCLLMQQKHAEAHEMALTYEKFWPGEYYVPLNDGYQLLSLGKCREAYEQYRRANMVCPNENPDKLRIVGEMAQVQLRLGMVEEAFVTMQCACSLGVGYIDVCLQMAQLAASVRQYEFATLRLREAVRMGCSPEQTETVKRMILQYAPYIDNGAVWDDEH